MPIERKDRVSDTTTTTGTGTVTLTGTAPTGYRSVSAAHTDGATVRYAISMGAEWEVGEGVYTASGTTLSRATVLASSNSGSLVDFSAGTKTVVTTLTAQEVNVASGLQQWDYSSDIASAATVDLGTATGNSVTVTHASGTTATTSFGGASLQKGTIIAVTPSISGGTYSLTHHATNLNLAGGADITLANGDTLLMRKEHDSNAEWKHVGGCRADGTAWVTSGNVKLAGDTVQVVEATPYTTAGSTATAIPLDSTIPQNTEGAELTTVTITPTSASNRLRIECNLPFLDGSGGIFMCAALFQDSTANALALGIATLNGANYSHNINFVHEMAAGTTSATTFKLRAGPNAGTMYFNRRQAGETLGGVSACRLRVTEIKV